MLDKKKQRCTRDLFFVMAEYKNDARMGHFLKDTVLSKKAHLPMARKTSVELTQLWRCSVAFKILRLKRDHDGRAERRGEILGNPVARLGPECKKPKPHYLQCTKHVKGKSKSCRNSSKQKHANLQICSSFMNIISRFCKQGKQFPTKMCSKSVFIGTKPAFCCLLAAILSNPRTCLSQPKKISRLGQIGPGGLVRF